MNKVLSGHENDFTVRVMVNLIAAPLPYCTDRRTVDYSRQVDFVVLLYDRHGGLQTGGAVAADALQGSPVGGLDVVVDTSAIQPLYCLTVRILERCLSAPSWLIARRAFTIRGAAEIQIVIGDAVILNSVGRRYALFLTSALAYSVDRSINKKLHYIRVTVAVAVAIFY